MLSQEEFYTQPTELQGPRTATPSAAPQGGGVLPGPQRQQARSFDEGGVVPTEDGAVGVAQGADAATMDPTQTVAKTLAYGRRKFGLPASFYVPQGGGQQAFDGGGMVNEDTGNGTGVLPDVTGDGNTPDPRQTLMYLTGAGNLAPDIVTALEQRIDPQGSMAPGERAMAALSSGLTPDTAFGLMQHYRTRYNAYAGGARAALSQGNLAQAAANGTQALGNIPTGYDIRFAPARDGVAMTARKIGKKAPIQSAVDGGLIEDQEDQQEDEFENKYDTMPESQNIEDRRGDKLDENYNEEVAWNKLVEGGKRHVQDIEQQLEHRAGARRVRNPGAYMARERIKASEDDSFAEGGLVEDDNYSSASEGVIPTEPAQVNDSTEPAEQVEPVILSPDQFNQIIDGGYDRPLDEGWGSFFGKILRGAKQNLLGDNPWQNRPAPSIERVAPATAGAEQTATQTQGGAAVEPSEIFERPDQQVATPRASSDERLNAYEKRIEARSRKIFPWVSQEEQRQAYVGQMMAKVMEGDLRIEQEHAKERGLIEAARAEARTKLQTQKDFAAGERQAQAQGGQDKRALMNNIRSRMNSITLNTPNIKPAELVTQLAREFGQPPQSVQQYMRGIIPPTSSNSSGGGGISSPQGSQHGTQQGNQASGQTSGSGALEAPQIGSVRPHTLNGQTRHYIYQKDGKWHLVPE